MRFSQVVMVTVALGALAGCETGKNSITDGGLDGGLLQDGVANVWTDPDGCQHWVIDDGIEGFMSPRLNSDGTPRCHGGREEIVLKDGTRVVAEQEPIQPLS